VAADVSDLAAGERTFWGEGGQPACPACGLPVYGASQWCKARRCPHYAPIWARDQQRKVFENLAAYDEGDGHAVMLTPTAPGVDVLPWDEDHCAALGPHDHSGELGCRVQRDAASQWNGTCSERWRRLHDRAARLAVRETGTRPLLLTRVFEKQRRGVLHVHAVIGRGSWAAKVSCAAYEKHLRGLASKYGFGHIDTPTGRARHARESAAYISSYLSRGKGAKRTLGETVRSDDLPKSIIYVSTALTMKTGVTMRALRFRRLVHARWGLELAFPEQRQVQALVDAFPGCELERGPPRTELAVASGACPRAPPPRRLLPRVRPKWPQYVTRAPGYERG
jgi:hypothetical protein